MSDSKYFTTTKKGEIFELKSELNSDKKEKKREAVKKVWFIIYIRDFIRAGATGAWAPAEICQRVPDTRPEMTMKGWTQKITKKCAKAM